MSIGFLTFSILSSLKKNSRIFLTDLLTYSTEENVSLEKLNMGKVFLIVRAPDVFYIHIGITIHCRKQTLYCISPPGTLPIIHLDSYILSF
jgi:hypothetical protein